MALTHLIAEEDARAAHALIVGIQRGTIEVTRGTALRLRAAEDIIRAFQTQERFGPERAAELAARSNPSADVRDYASLTDAELEAKVAAIIEFPRRTS
ncbi:MAG: hypothetical protein QM692_08180 [Thermomicrobiales bacterium]